MEWHSTFSLIGPHWRHLQKQVYRLQELWHNAVHMCRRVQLHGEGGVCLRDVCVHWSHQWHRRTITFYYMSVAIKENVGLITPIWKLVPFKNLLHCSVMINLYLVHTLCACVCVCVCVLCVCGVCVYVSVYVRACVCEHVRACVQAPKYVFVWFMCVWLFLDVEFCAYELTLLTFILF